MGSLGTSEPMKSKDPSRKQTPQDDKGIGLRFRALAFVSFAMLIDFLWDLYGNFMRSAIK
jgi:hypothetical protein